MKLWLLDAECKMNHPEVFVDGYRCRAFPTNTLLRSSGFSRSCSASELLLTQKTELPRLATVCSGKPDTTLTWLGLGY